MTFGIVLMVLGIGGIALLFAWQKKEKKVEISNVTKYDATAHYMDMLLGMNKKVRMDPDVSDSLEKKVEEVIDKTRNLIEKTEDQKKQNNEVSNSLQITLNRIADKYLPSLLNPYLNSSKEAKAKNEAKIEKALDSISGELDSISRAIDKGLKSDYEKAALIIDKIFETIEEA